MALSESEELELLELEEQEAQQAAPATPVANAEGEMPTDAKGMAIGSSDAFERSGYNKFSTNPVGQRLLENVIDNPMVQGYSMGQLAGAGTEGALLGAKAIGKSNVATNLRNYLGKKLGKYAENTAIESIHPTTTSAKQLGETLGGPQGVRDAGRYLLDEKVVTPGASAEEMTARLGGLSDRAGRHIGEWRDKADLRSIAQGVERPSSLDIEKAIKQELSGKYGAGAEAGQAGQLDNAIDEIRKLAPVNQSTTGAEMAQTVDDIGGNADEAYMAARAKQEALPEMTDGFPYLHDQPTFTELAGTSTRLNDVAKNARQINQPDGALTDAANILSRKSTEGIDDILTSAEKPQFAADKAEFGMTKGLEKIADRTQYRELGTGQSELPVSHYAWYSKAFQTVMPLSRQATIADKLSKALTTNPQAFGRNTETIARAMKSGKAALASTIYMLQQQDPEFKQKFEEMQNQ